MNWIKVVFLVLTCLVLCLIAGNIIFGDDATGAILYGIVCGGGFIKAYDRGYFAWFLE